jgi:hypothetical protein
MFDHFVDSNEKRAKMFPDEDITRNEDKYIYAKYQEPE